MELLHAGKVRDVYAYDDDLLLVASDRVSVYDVVLPTAIPDKGRILTQLSVWWFDQLSDICPNHVLSVTDVPPQFKGRALRCRRLEMVPVECVARGYLAGSGWSSYQRTGSIVDVRLPTGLLESSPIDPPVFTPTTKTPPEEGHDAPMTYADVEALVGTDTARELRDLTLEIYGRGASVGRSRGVIVADTKLEFGRAATGELVLADEVLTPDSSRFWPASEWAPGGPQPSYDKQYVRDWTATTDWDRTDPGPELPDEIVEGTRQRYVEIYERLTGDRWR